MTVMYIDGKMLSVTSYTVQVIARNSRGTFFARRAGP